MRKKVLFTILWSASAILVLHLLALEFYFYWTMDWYDILMHISGGALIALISIWLIFFSRYIPVSLPYTSRNIIRAAVWGTLVVGLLWEVWEFNHGMTVFSLPDMIDTAKDVCNDTIGALSVAWYFYSLM